MKNSFNKDLQYFKFCTYGFLKNLRFFEPFLMVYLLEKLGGNYTQVGFLYSLRFILRALLEIPSGIVADSLGRRGSMVFSYCLYISSFLSYYFANNLLTLLIPTVLFGIGDAFRTGTHKAMIVDYLTVKGWKEHKTTYYGLTRSWSQTGSAASSLIVFVIYIIKPDYGFIFLVTTIPYLLGLLNLISYPKYLDINPERKTKKKQVRLKTSTIESIQIISNFNNLKKLTGASICFGFYHSIKDYLQPTILSLGITLPFLSYKNSAENVAIIIPLFYFGLYIATTFASRKAGKIQGLLKLDKKSISLLTTLGGISGFLYSALYLLDFQFISIIPFIFIFILINFQRPSVVSYISSQFEQKHMATVLSIESQTGSIIAGVIALAIGFLSDLFSPTLGIGIISIILVLLSLIKWFPKDENY